MPTTVTALPLPQPTEHPPTAILIGVDTHKAAHVAVAVTALGARVAACSATADRDGYAALLAWARTLGRVEAFGVEGTGSYGAGLTSFLRRHDVRVVEVSPGDRRTRRTNGKAAGRHHFRLAPRRAPPSSTSSSGTTASGGTQVSTT